MRDRLVALAGHRAGEVTICTFHAFCTRVLRRHGKWLAIEPSFAVWDDSDSREAVRLAAKSLEIQLDEVGAVRVHERISQLKSLRIYPQNWRGEDLRLLKLYRAYQRLLAISNAIDFDDLIAQTWTLFRRYPNILQEWAENFSWVSVDEFQDTAEVEYKLVHLLTKGHQNLAVFGDTDQWIYR